MTRPTREQVTNALQWAGETPLESWEAPAVLAAEVRAMQEDLERLRTAARNMVNDLDPLMSSRSLSKHWYDRLQPSRSALRAEALRGEP